jgi:hypothetical protein
MNLLALLDRLLELFHPPTQVHKLRSIVDAFLAQLVAKSRQSIIDGINRFSQASEPFQLKRKDSLQATDGSRCLGLGDTRILDQPVNERSIRHSESVDEAAK